MDPRTLMTRPTVAVLYKYVPQYRRRFFELLSDHLTERDVELILVYGDPGPEDVGKGDAVELPWATKVPNVTITVAGRTLYWQRALKVLHGADLVIVEQASKLLINYALLALQTAGRTRLALWGHGVNLKQEEASRLGEALKRAVSRRAAWWFAYTDATAALVRGLGYPAQRITVVQNAIDTRELTAGRERLTTTETGREEVAALRRRLGLRGYNVGLFVGALYKQKRLPFLLEACVRIRELAPDFEMVFVGGGPDKPLVERAAAAHPWIHAAGPVFDEARVPYFLLADLVLMPGLVGLGILDCFALEVPMVTTAVHYHSPEIAYLDDGVNGMMLSAACSPAQFAEAVAALLHDAERAERLRAGCRQARSRYTVEEMVERFADGVTKALDVQGLAQ